MKKPHGRAVDLWKSCNTSLLVRSICKWITFLKGFSKSIANRRILWLPALHVSAPATSSSLYCRLNVMELIGNNHLPRSPEGIKLIPIPSNPPCGQPVHKIPRNEQNNEPDNTDDFRILIQRHMVEIRLFFRKVSAFPCNI